MPNIKSAKKRAAIELERRKANQAKRSALRTAVKRVTASLEGQPADARADLIRATKALDQAAAAGLIHKNTAARKKSRLTRRLNALAKEA